MSATVSGATLQKATPALTKRQRTLWVIGSTPASFAAADPILEQVKIRFPRLHIIVTPRDRTLTSWLRGHYPDRIVDERPPTFAPFCRRVVSRRNPRLILLLDGVTALETPLLHAARRRQIPIASLASGPTGYSAAPTNLMNMVERFVALDQQSLAGLAACNVPPARIVDATDAGETATETLSALLRRDLKALRSERDPFRRGLEQLVLAAVDHPWGRRLASRRAERITTLDDLAERLGRPHTILCLGNGPSSEDPRVRNVAHDALFRVNHLWQERGVLTNPHMVFTGSTDTVRRIGTAIVGISLVHHEGRLLVAGLARGNGQFRFVTLERLGILPRHSSWGEAVPTNGAFMLATAVALHPARLIIAGIDLFRHRDGAYPGDVHTPNAYTPRHAADLDERVILQTLDSYRGELLILSDVLRGVWETRGRSATEPDAAVVTATTRSYVGGSRTAQ